MTDPRAGQKRAAAEAAVALVADGMAVGLGTGSTAAFAIDALAARVRAGLSIMAIATSEHSAAQARANGIRVVGFAECRRLDLTIDGADEIARGTLALIKGHGGALLREKIVAAASDRLVIIADASKLVDRLGGATPVPIEVVPFGWETTAARIEREGGQPRLRVGNDGTPVRTDGGNLILDCGFATIGDPAALDRTLSQLIGVIETGLFNGMASCALVADEQGVQRLEPRS
ncbi:MAG TPA: ribose-5-phosphate isomerase RpiA [Acetobacteraceae bacterium]|nr:ribose-5-phosphate isomerase RpiA [Acetobacteraceae bacterium]